MIAFSVLFCFVIPLSLVGLDYWEYIHYLIGFIALELSYSWPAGNFVEDTGKCRFDFLAI